MSYLLDKKNKKRRIEKIIALSLFLILAFFFRLEIYRGLTAASHFVAYPFVKLGGGIGKSLSGYGSYFSSKRILSLENENLKLELAQKNAELANYSSILDENSKIKEIMGRKKSKNNFVLAGVLNKPDRSFYDTLIIDAGEDDGVVAGQKVFAYGDIPIGYIAESYSDSAKIILYSNPGEKTEVAITGKDVFMTAIGRGSGNFEMILPRDFTIENGTAVVLPGITSYVVANVETIVSDPRDSYEKALLKSPVNIFELRYVEVEK